MIVPELERPVYRFPRTDDDDLLFMRELRLKYPAPKHDPFNYGPYNPADYVINAVLSYKTKKLRRLCRKHALRSDGSRQKLMRRMYLHWRSNKFKLGPVYYGYGPGCWNTRVPTCICGYLRRDDMEGREQEKKDRRELNKQQREAAKPIMRFPREAVQRFPRYK